MKQSRIDSFMEAVVNIIIGLIISTLANWIILPVVLGVTLTLSDNLLIGGFFTVISIIRSYSIRRLFNGRSPWETIRDSRALAWLCVLGIHSMHPTSSHGDTWFMCTRCGRSENQI